MRFVSIALFVLMLGVLPHTSVAQECQIGFVDQGSSDPSFVTFRNRLLRIIERRDKAALLAVLDPRIKVSFGGKGGKNDFVRYWNLNTRRTRVWEELGKVLSNGGYMNADGSVKTFSAPYSFDGFPGECHVELDAFVHQIIFGKDVALRRAPSLDGEVITRLSYNVVTLVGEKTVAIETGEHSVPEWYYIKTLGGLEGYVNARFVRSPIDYRAIFQRKNGRWSMVAFVVGD